MGNYTPIGFVYGLHNGDHEIRYVGKTTMPLLRRLSSHLTAARGGRQTPVASWLRKYPECAQIVALAILNVGSPSGLNAIERQLIATHRARAGSRMLNLADGGEGQPGHIPSPETRRLISEAGKGRVYTPEQRARISAALRGRKLSPEHVSKIVKSKTGANNPNHGVPKSESFKAHMREVQKLRWSEPGTVSAMSKKMRESPNLGLGQHRRWHSARSIYKPECKFCVQESAQEVTT